MHFVVVELLPYILIATASDHMSVPLVRSTVGLVLDGVTVKMVVPGSPSSKTYDGQRIEPGDVVTHINMCAVEAHNVVSTLRGDDLPGTPVSVTVMKGSTMQAAVFDLVRADMRNVLVVKDLYLALGDVID